MIYQNQQKDLHIFTRDGRTTTLARIPTLTVYMRLDFNFRGKGPGTLHTYSSRADGSDPPYLWRKSINSDGWRVSVPAELLMYTQKGRRSELPRQRESRCSRTGSEGHIVHGHGMRVIIGLLSWKEANHLQ